MATNSKEFMVGLFLMLHFQVAVVLKFQPENEMKSELHNTKIFETDLQNNREHHGQLFYNDLQSKNFLTDQKKDNPESDKNLHSRKTRSATNNSTTLAEQFAQVCVNVGSHSCTCYYPDHPSVPQFELSTDELTQIASAINGTGPSSCQDLKALGATLEGFYMIRLNKKRVKAIYCNFHNEKVDIKKPSIQEVGSEISSKPMRFCGRSNSQGKQCTYLYSDYPDAQRNGNKKTDEKGPSSCKDLQIIGHTLQGFYLVWLNSINVKIIYCDFLHQTTDAATNMGSNLKINFECKGLGTVGSQPCSCYYSTNTHNILKFELSNDEITRKASTYNGPASCKDLETIGYIVNGFYMVRFNSNLMKTIYCKFHPDLIENVKNQLTEISTFKPTVRMSTTVTQQPDSILKSTKVVPSRHNDDKNFLLMNKHNKCMSTRRLNQYEVGVVQSNCNPRVEEQLWKWVGDYLRNEFGFVSKVQKGFDYFEAYLYFFQTKSKWINQKWHATDEGKIVSNTGLCLSVANDSELHDVVLSMDSCEKNKKGQFWDRIPQPN